MNVGLNLGQSVMPNAITSTCLL